MVKKTNEAGFGSAALCGSGELCMMKGVCELWSVVVVIFNETR